MTRTRLTNIYSGSTLPHDRPDSPGRFSFYQDDPANGLDVIVRHQAQLPVVAINLWYHVGSKNEERSQRGFTHLFEHLMFEGSEHYPGDFFKHLQRVGANINGSTSSDRTNYFVDLPTAHAELAMAMESDRMAHLLGALNEEKLRIQKDVVKNEYRQNYANRPYGMVWSLLAESLYPPQHPYNWLTIGVMEDIERATMDDVSAFFRRYYVPSNASLSVVGDLDESRRSRWRSVISVRSRGARPRSPWAPAVELAENREIVVHDRVELDRLYLVWPTVPHFHADDAPLILLGDVLARGRVEPPLSQAGRRGADRPGRERVPVGPGAGRSFGVVVTLRPSRSIDQARDLVDAELAAFEPRR